MPMEMSGLSTHLASLAPKVMEGYSTVNANADREVRGQDRSCFVIEGPTGE
jgi:hypothetical protein